MALTQEMIDKLRKIAAESTNELARNGAKAKLQAEGVSLTESKPEKVMVAPKPKAERKKREPKAKVVSTNEKRESPDKDKDYKTYCDELISKADERKAKAKAAAAKRANEPKKTQATKNVEAVDKTAERVEKNVEKRVKKGDVSVAEIDKIIAEYETALTKLRALREKATSKMRKGGGVDAEEVEHILMRAQGVKKMANGGNVSSEIAKIKSSLISRAKSKGISENFGQNEVRKLEDKYGYTKEVQAFDDWAMNYDGGSMATGGGVGKYDVGDTLVDGVGNRLTITAISKEKGYKVISKDSPMGAWYSKEGLDRFNKPQMAKGGKLVIRNGREYPTGSAWKIEHSKRNKGEKWEQYAEGGGVNYKKNWEVVYITLKGKMGKKTITLGRMSDKEDVKQALRRMDLNIREVTSIKEVK